MLTWVFFVVYRTEVYLSLFHICIELYCILYCKVFLIIRSCEKSLTFRSSYWFSFSPQKIMLSSSNYNDVKLLEYNTNQSVTLDVSIWFFLITVSLQYTFIFKHNVDFPHQVPIDHNEFNEWITTVIVLTWYRHFFM